jgi:hypothetical protein
VVFLDFDNDGVLDPDEPLGTGYVVWLDTNDNGVVDAGEQTTTSDENGAYRFENLAANTTYNVRALNFNDVPTGPRFVFVGPGDTVTGVDLGIFTPPS